MVFISYVVMKAVIKFKTLSKLCCANEIYMLSNYAVSPQLTSEDVQSPITLQIVSLSMLFAKEQISGLRL